MRRAIEFFRFHLLISVYFWMVVNNHKSSLSTPLRSVFLFNLLLFLLCSTFSFAFARPCLINHFAINGEPAEGGAKRRKFPVVFNYEFYDVIWALLTPTDVVDIYSERSLRLVYANSEDSNFYSYLFHCSPRQLGKCFKFSRTLWGGGGGAARRSEASRKHGWCAL